MTQSTIRAGSVKNKIVASDLEEERLKINFDANEMGLMMQGGPEVQERIRSLIKDMESDPALIHTEKYYEMSREELYVELLKRVRKYYDLYNEKYFSKYEWSYIPWWAVAF